MAGNPLQELLHKHVGIDSFALDGDEVMIADPWTDRPARARSRPQVRA